MRAMKIANIAVVIAFAGFAIAAFFKQMDIGRLMIIVGFYMAVGAISWGMLQTQFDTATKKFGSGIKIAAIGLFVGSFSFLADYFLHSPKVAAVIFWVGFCIAAVGALVSIFQVGKRN